MAKLVIQLGALDDLVGQLKKAANGQDVENNDMSYEKGVERPEMAEDADEDDAQSYSMWVCEQCGSELKCTMPKQMMNCPCCNGAAMVKKS